MTTSPATAVRRMLPSLVLNAVAPLLVYLLLSPLVGNDVVALAVGATIPVLVTGAEFAWRRRVDPIGVVAIVSFAIVLTVLAFSGGNPLVLKLHDVIITGPLGLVFLLSVLVRKPLLLVIRRSMGSRGAPSTLDDATQRHALSVLTALTGVTMFVHAAVILMLALNLPTSTFLAIGRPVGWAVLAVGLAGVFTYRRKIHRLAEPS